VKKLVSRRALLVKQKVAFDLSLKEQKASMEPELFSLLSTQNEVLLGVFTKQIQTLNKQIQDTIEQDESMKQNNQLAQSVVGIGPVISAYLIASTENFKSFTNPKKYACYAGVAPFPNSSGKFKGRTRVSHLANKKIKAIISNAVVTAIRYDKEIQLYFNRKLKEGKNKRVIYNAIKNKLIHRVFAVVKRKSPYIKLMNYA
jgi:transposase